MISDKIIKPYVNKKANLSDWNGGWRLLENKGQFSACDVLLTKPSLSNGKALIKEGRLRPSRPGTAVTRPTEALWDCGYSSHRSSLGLRLLVPPKLFGTAVTRPTEALWDNACMTYVL